MKFQRFEVPGLAHYSYVLGAAGKAVVVDPKRDIDTYLEYARVNDLSIAYILETHIHADYCSGAKELAEATGAELWLSAHDTGEDFIYQFPHKDFKDGEALELGEVRIVALHTPGHTPEHLSFLVYDIKRSATMPMLMLSGDFVFVGSLGRPDLLGESAKLKLAGQLYDSLNSKIAELPDGLEVHPAHGAGSMCGAGMGDRPQTTLGYERLSNMFFADRDKPTFVHHILSTVPPFPDYYRRMKKVNSDGPKTVGVEPPRALAVDEFKKAAFGVHSNGGEHVVIDLRRPEAFGGAHIPGAFNIGQAALFSIWASWVVPYDKPILLVGDASTNYDEARRALLRVGLDDVRGYLKGGMTAWVEAGHEQAHVPQISVGELAALKGTGGLILDVRADGEWNSGHIAGATHIMGGDLPKRAKELPRDRKIYAVCGAGYRSSVATSVLKRAGFRDVVNVDGGMGAWNRQKLPTVTEEKGAAVSR
ncbi:MAG: MBL fold metallo-hydrolase [Candidatus Koribacter versatilis]|uniref:MBL fold metallo-hydrolase n=1 Tax=Candidatus Korobacter versatilis TaxID=658062 RepID=A0A932EPE3_9BACT|nr:MBL fold metallo-hydrolase [Candidatus Koribacter versatilis]